MRIIICPRVTCGGNCRDARLVYLHLLEDAVALESPGQFGNVLIPQSRGKYPIRLFLQMKIVVAPTITEDFKWNLVDGFGVNVGLLLHSLSVCGNEDTAGIWVTSWAYWEVGLSPNGVPMAILYRRVIETCHLTLGVYQQCCASGRDMA